MKQNGKTATMWLGFSINAHQNADQNPIGSAPAYQVQCTLPPQPIYQTLLSDFLRVWLRDYDLQYYISLISRPFSPPVFDHLQFFKGLVRRLCKSSIISTWDTTVIHIHAWWWNRLALWEFMLKYNYGNKCSNLHRYFMTQHLHTLQIDCDSS